MRYLILLLTCCLAAPALAGVGLNLYGFAWYPDEPDDAVLNADLFGLGLQYDLRVREDSRLYLEGGAFNDIYEHANMHLGAGYRHRVAGPVFVGGGLYLVKTPSLNDGDPFLAPMPQLSLVGGPGALTAMWNPRLDGVAEYEAFTFYGTLFPFGRTAAGAGALGWSDRRDALEFSFRTDAGFSELRDKQLVWRKVDPAAGGIRVGVRVDVAARKRESEVQTDRSNDYNADLFVERLRFLGPAGPLRGYLTFGPAFGFGSDHVELVRTDPEARQTTDVTFWSAGLRCGLGVEWAVTGEIAFTAETGWIGRYSEQTTESPAGGPPRVESIWDLTDTGVQTGIVLYFD
jgi:hypothetical protein